MISRYVIVGFISICSILLWGCPGSNGDDPGNNSVQSSGKVDITLQLEGINGGGGMLGGIRGENFFTLDENTFDANGKITFTANELYPKGFYYIVLPDQQTTVQFLLDEDQEFSLKANTQNMIATMKVDGSLTNKLFYENQRFEQEYQQKLNAIKAQVTAATPGSAEQLQYQQQIDALVAEREQHIKSITSANPGNWFSVFKLAGQNPKLKDVRKPNGEIDKDLQVYHYRNEFWDNVDFSDSSLLRTPVYGNKLKQYIDKLVPQDVDSLIKYAGYITRKAEADPMLFMYTANYIGTKYKEPEFMGGDAVYVYMVQNFFTKDKAFWATEDEIRALQSDAKYRERSMIGVTGNNITAPNLKGEMVSLYDLNKELTVLFMYNPDCEHCQEQAPKVVDIYNQWKGRIDVYGMCIDSDMERCKKFIEKYNMPWHNIVDETYESKYNQLYHIDITPEIYVLDKDHKVIAKDLKASQMEEVFNRHFSGQ